MTGLAAAEFFARVRARLTLDVPAGLTDPSVTPARGDHDADPVMRKIAEVRPIRPAAVLVPIVDHAEPTVLLTQRAQHLPDHAGQVSFPGGKIDKDDADPCASALARSRGRDRPRPRSCRAARLSRSVHDDAWLSHRAGDCARASRASRSSSIRARWMRRLRCRLPS